MGKRTIRRAALFVGRIASAISRIFTCGLCNLTPKQKARLDEMEKDYEAFVRQRPAGTKVNRPENFATETN
jgi:hypothetical protein